jgi:hypothetical protein
MEVQVVDQWCRSGAGTRRVVMAGITVIVLPLVAMIAAAA